MKHIGKHNTLVISFSGGETSAFMTMLLLDYNKKFKRWSNVIVIFANTGEEHEKTLVFVDKCDEHFDFNTIWIEGSQNHGERKSPDGIVVSFTTASRNGEPFRDFIKKHGISNSKFKSCTRELKEKPIENYLKSIGVLKGTYDLAIGIRTDEMDRCNFDNKRDIIYPLATHWPTTKVQINTWWRDQPFRLNLKHWQGNCKWCWKKTKRKHFTLIRHTPEVFKFPSEMEDQFGKVGAEFRKGDLKDYRRVFFRGNTSTKDLFKEFAFGGGHLKEDYHDDAMIFDVDLDIAGSCDDSCEVFTDE